MHFDTFKCQKNLAKDILANAKVVVSQDTMCLAHSQSSTWKVRGVASLHHQCSSWDNVPGV